MLSFLRYPTLLALWLGLPRLLPAQVLDPAFHIPAIYREATVNDAARQADGQYVVAGTFTRVNSQSAAHLIRLDATGALDAGFQQNLSRATVQARKVYPLPNGQLLVLGTYQAGAVQRNYLFRLNADGTLDPTLTLTFAGPYPYPSVAQALVQPDGRLLILGYFTSSSAEIYRLLPDGTRDSSFSTTLVTGSQDTQMLLQPDGKLILGGDVTTQVNGRSNHFITRLNSDGSPDADYHSGAYSNNPLTVHALLLDASGALLVGGYAGNVVGGQPRAVFRLLPSGALDPSFTLDASLAGRNCQRLATQPGGQIAALFDAYATTAGGGTVPYPFSSQLVRLLPTGALDAAFQPGSGPDGLLTEVRSQPDGSLLTWGGINNFAGQRRTLALLQPSGALNSDFAPLLQVPGSVQKVVRQADDKVVLLGQFNSIDGHLTDRVARLLPSGQPDLAFAYRQLASATSSITTLAVQRTGQVILAGAEYGSTGAGIRPFFRQLMATGEPDASFVPAITVPASPTAGIWLLLAQADGKLVVGGSFTDAAGKANLTRLTAVGSVDPTFAPPTPQAEVYSGYQQADGTIMHLAPTASSVTYPYSQTIKRLLANGQPDPTFSYAPLAPAPGIGLSGIFPVPATGGCVVSGTFEGRQVLARLSASGAHEAGFATPFRSFDGPADSFSGVNVVAPQPEGRLLIGGTMRTSADFSSAITPLARLEANGQLDATFSTSFIPNPPLGSAGYNSVAVSDILTQPDGTTLIGGNFLLAGGQPATGLVRLLPPAAPLGTNNPRPDTYFQAWPVPARDVLHVSLPPATHPQRVTLLNMMGQTMLSQAVAATEITLATASLAPGIYLLRVEYADGIATRPVVLE